MKLFNKQPLTVVDVLNLELARLHKQLNNYSVTKYWIVEHLELLTLHLIELSKPVVVNNKEV